MVLVWYSSQGSQGTQRIQRKVRGTQLNLRLYPTATVHLRIGSAAGTISSHCRLFSTNIKECTQPSGHKLGPKLRCWVGELSAATPSCGPEPSKDPWSRHRLPPRGNRQVTSSPQSPGLPRRACTKEDPQDL